MHHDNGRFDLICLIFYLLYYFTRIDLATEVFLATTFVLPTRHHTKPPWTNRNQGPLLILISKMDYL